MVDQSTRMSQLSIYLVPLEVVTRELPGVEDDGDSIDCTEICRFHRNPVEIEAHVVGLWDSHGDGKNVTH